MTNYEPLSTFYNRFKVRYEACNTLGVAGFEDKWESIYVKQDGPKYAALYRENVNFVNRNIVLHGIFRLV